jgi:hypothetical protein
MGKHLAEMLLDLKFHGKPDPLRKTKQFSEDITAANSILFNPGLSKLRKVKAYRRWLETGQPCVFGRMAAKNENIFFCLIDEHEVLTMRRGDDDLRDTIQDYRQVWKRYALEGSTSSFVILLISPNLVNCQPDDRLKELCRRLMQLYMELPKLDDDSYHTQREYVFLRGVGQDPTKLLKFSTLPNVFCAQGDGRWWHDHRTPGGVMITSNALGHFAYSRSQTRTMGDKEKLESLQNAMRTINYAFKPPRKNSGLTHCPATSLVDRASDEATPLPARFELHGKSPNKYRGFFHTDHLIPSVFFRPERDPKELQSYEGLELSYIFDAIGDPEGHAELMTGTAATSYDVKRNLDRIPDFANPESDVGLTAKTRGRLLAWLEKRTKSRLN